MVHFYKEHEIIINAIEFNPGRWYTDIVIMWQDGQMSANRPCTIWRLFETRSQAENHSLTLVKKWIDDGKPALLPKRSRETA